MNSPKKKEKEKKKKKEEKIRGKANEMIPDAQIEPASRVTVLSDCQSRVWIADRKISLFKSCKRQQKAIFSRLLLFLYFLCVSVLLEQDSSRT